MRNKKKIMEISLFAVIILGVAIYAFLGNKSHTDMYGEIISNNNSEDNSQSEALKYEYFVAQFPEGMIDHMIEFLSGELPESPYIIRCTVLEGQEPAFGGVRVKVKVNKVYQGDDIKENDEIYVVNDAWQLYPENGKMYIEFKFHNIMKPGEEYLIFLCEHLDITEEKYGDTYSMEGYIMTPMFLCEDRINVVVDTTSAYVSYEEVKNNDVYFSNQEDLDKYLDFKKAMLEKYN